MRSSEKEVKHVEYVWLVRFGMLNKPVKVLDSDLTPVQKEIDLPMLFSVQPPYPDWVRKELSEEAKQRPRDKNGRWI